MTARSVRLTSGRDIEADGVVITTGAAAPDWFGGSGLAVDRRGFLATEPTLQVVGEPDVFAAGDCATVLAHPRPKAGVFAVRQGPPLAANLRRRIAGEPTLPFRPQKRFLMLMSEGDGRAIASWGPLAAEGRWLFRWKDAIDRRFMRQFETLPARAALVPGEEPGSTA